MSPNRYESWPYWGYKARWAEALTARPRANAATQRANIPAAHHAQDWNGTSGVARLGRWSAVVRTRATHISPFFEMGSKSPSFPFSWGSWRWGHFSTSWIRGATNPLSAPSSTSFSYAPEQHHLVQFPVDFTVSFSRSQKQHFVSLSTFIFKDTLCNLPCRISVSTWSRLWKRINSIWSR